MNGPADRIRRSVPLLGKSSRLPVALAEYTWLKLQVRTGRVLVAIYRDSSGGFVTDPIPDFTAFTVVQAKSPLEEIEYYAITRGLYRL